MTPEALAAHQAADELDPKGVTAGPIPVPSDVSQDDLGVKGEVARLAALDPLDYDRARESAAKELGVRVATLDNEVKQRRPASKPDQRQEGVTVEIDDPEPWAEPVSIGHLLDDLVEMIRRYVRTSDDALVAVALWVLHCHAHDCFGISPILGVTSPVPGCGKTTLLTLLGALCPRPLTASNITAAALFRSVERWKPTLLVDEADTFLKNSDELRGVINSGHHRGSAFVIRTTGDDHEPRRFGTWAPKAVALIGKLPDTLSSRSIHVEMRRLEPDDSVEELRADKLQHLEPLQRQGWRWAQDNAQALHDADPVVPLRMRDADNWRPLLAIAEVAGGEWLARAQRAAETLSASEDDQPRGIQLLADIKGVFERLETDRLTSAGLVAQLTSMEERPWTEWRDGKPLTKRQMANLLKPFGIQPRTVRIADETAKGYALGSFDDAFRRYLTVRSVTPSQPLQTGALEAI